MLFFGEKRKKKLTQKQFDEQVEQLVQLVKSSVSPFEHDTAEKQQARVRRAQHDQDYFNQTYLPHYFSQPGADFHREMEERIEDGERQQRPVAEAAPRGHAKSTRITFARALKKAIFHEKKFIILISDTETQARGFTVSIRVEIEHNPRILHDFDNQKTPQWAVGDFVLKSGARVLARGDGQGIRGLKHGPHRPDLIVIDDIENDESVRNPDRIKQTYNWIMEAVIPSMEPAKGVLFIIGTLLSQRSVLAQCLANPEFIAHVARAIEDPTWSEETREFTAGIPLWPARFSLAKLSAIRRLIGSVSFNKEYQNNPQDDDSIFKQDWFRRCKVAALPNLPLYFYQAIDPSLKQKRTSDFKAEITVAKGGPHIYVRHASIKRISLDAMIRQAYDLHARFQPLQIGLETEGWQSLLRREFDRLAAAKNSYLPIVPIEHHGVAKDDDTRIGGLSPMAENGVLIFCEGPASEVGEMETLIEQFIFFGSASVHDDGPDACEMAVRLAEKRAALKVGYETVSSYSARFAEGAY